MNFDARLVVITLATFAFANLICCALVSWLWRRRTPSSLVRAESLRHLRLLPALVATLSMTMAAVSFLFFEPRGHEPIGLVMPALAGLTTVLWAGAFWRGLRVVTTTLRATRDWMADARPITLDGWSWPAFVVDSEFPIVAVVGIWRPRLIVARRVLDACTPGELRAILAHEQGHAERGDNLGRLLIAVTPDVISWVPLSNRIAAAWHDAVEDAADECADALGKRGRLLLAEALIRVARMAPSRAPAALPTSALYRGENIERRVRRLLGPREPVTIRWSRGQRRLGRAAFILACVLALEGVYEIVEAAVTFLP
jgi:Zn-dependent protease with chaperone function